MPIASLKLTPTVTSELTPSLNESGISSSNLIRFKAGLPEKLGGWERYVSASLSGIPRAAHAWQDLNSIDHLAIGTVGSTGVLDVITGTSIANITPQQRISNFVPNFSTVPNSTTITITDPNIATLTINDAVFFNTPIAVGGIVLQGLNQITGITGTSSYTIDFTQAAISTATGTGMVPSFTTGSGNFQLTVGLTSHGLTADDNFTFPILTSGNGVNIQGTYPLLTVPSTATFTISASTQATATSTFRMNNGSAQLVYYIATGPAAIGAGYGLGGYGLGGYGTGVLSNSQVGSAIMASDWTLDNWGELLLACPSGGGIYWWGPSDGFTVPKVVAEAPPFNTGIFVAMPAQILVAYGSTTLSVGSLKGVEQDPLQVNWSDSENFFNWTIDATTQAGSYRLPRGSLIVGGMQGPQQALLWTDLALWAMVYQGPPFVFGFNEIMTGCGLIGIHARCSMRGGVFWMGTGNFFVLGNSGPQSIPCSVWDIVFQDLDRDNQHKCVAAPDSQFDEVFFFYPSLSGGTGEVDKYVKYNIEDKAWDYGNMPRSAWIDQSVLGQPIGCTPTGIVYQHEISPDADGQPLMASFTTGWFAVSEGRDLMFVDWMFPDLKWRYANGSAPSASVQVLIEAAQYPNSVPKIFGPFTLDESKEFINLRLRGRLVRLTYSSNDTGTWWRLGNQRYRGTPDGMR